MNDVLGMSGVQPVGDFDGDIKQPLNLHQLAIDGVLVAAVEELHGDEALAFMLSDFINEQMSDDSERKPGELRGGRARAQEDR
jgi:hypothetical protein